ncbi:MAG: hypothetical protein AABY22_11050 [Nanoarchaeota archaeon]
MSKHIEGNPMIEKVEVLLLRFKPKCSEPSCTEYIGHYPTHDEAQDAMDERGWVWKWGGDCFKPFCPEHGKI